MCDYSLESFARRDAKPADQLRTARLGVHGSVGLVASEEPKTAVCLRPGTRLIVSGIPANLQRAWGVGEVVIATFMKRDLIGVWNRSGYHRDGVRFDGADQEIILLQEFPSGIEVSVETVPEDNEKTLPQEVTPELILV